MTTLSIKRLSQALTIAGIAALVAAVLFAGHSVLAQTTVDSDTSVSSDNEAVVCTMDAYQCPDGSWVGRTGPNCEFVCSDGVVDENDRAQNHNSSRSNQTGRSSDSGDVDMDGRSDPVRSDSSAQPKIIDNERAQDPDSDDDGVEDAGVRGIGVTKELDKASPRLGVDQSSPLLYQGVSVRVPEDACTDEDCDDGVRVVSPREIGLHVSGVTVRGWSAEQKERVRMHLSEVGEVNTANDFGIWTARQALENESIVDIDTDEEQTQVRYRTQLRLFGFIPVNAEAVARADANGEVSVDYPWYRFLSRVDDDGFASELVRSIRTLRDSLGGDENDESAE